MSLWSWLSTPVEPRGWYAVRVGVLTGVLMLVSAPLWLGTNLVLIGLAGGISGGLAGVLAKLWMERR